MLERVLTAWISTVWRFSRSIIAIISMLMLIASYYSFTHFSIKTDTRDMLSAELPWRQLDIEYERLFPQQKDSLLLVIEADTPDKAKDTAKTLYEELKRQSTHYKHIYYPEGSAYLQKSALLFLELKELQALSDRLALFQPFIAKLGAEQNLQVLLELLLEINRLEPTHQPLIDDFYHEMRTVIHTVLDNQNHQISWQKLLHGAKGTPPYRQFIIIHPDLDYQALYPAKKTIIELKKLANSLGMNMPGAAQLYLSGEIMLAHEELVNVSEGNFFAVLLAFFMVATILLTGLRSLAAIFSSLLSLLAGLIFTTVFALLTIGTLNLISVAFAVLYIGLGIDFAIHFCLHYQTTQNDKQKSQVVIRIGQALILCALTTSAGFYAFMFTAYDGLAELGWIAGSSMFISLLLSLTFLPALLYQFPNKKPIALYTPPYKPLIGLATWPVKYARIICIIAGITGFIMLSQIPKITFDPNTLHLQNAQNESVIVYKNLLAESNAAPWAAVILTKSKTKATQLIAQLKTLSVVDDVHWLEDFIPDKQTEKLSLITDMELLLGPQPTPSKPLLLDGKKITKLLHDLYIAIEDQQKPLAQTLATFLSHLNNSTPEQQVTYIKKLEHGLIGHLPNRLNELYISLTAEPVKLADLPDQLIENWYNEKVYLLRIFPTEDISNNEALRTFAKTLISEIKTLTGPPIVMIAAADSVVLAFQKAFLYAFIAITIILLLMLRNITDTFIIMLCLLFSVLLTMGLSLFLNITFNFANVIALPLLLGIGVDSAVHLLYQYRIWSKYQQNILNSIAAKGILISSLTTIFGIGNLMFSGHPGTASMGALLTLGISVSIICNLILLPAILSLKKT